MTTITITFDGIAITNPYMDETGRFEVDPESYYGIKVEPIFGRSWELVAYEVTGRIPASDDHLPSRR